MGKLTSAAVDKILKKCFFTEEELSKVVGEPSATNLPEHAIVTTPIVQTIVLHGKRVEERKAQIRELLMELDDPFMASKGGGMTFLNACTDKHGNHWGEHRNVAALCALGEAAGLLSYPMPRDMWSMLPGGMPYITVIDK